MTSKRPETGAQQRWVWVVGLLVLAGALWATYWGARSESDLPTGPDLEPPPPVTAPETPARAPAVPVRTQAPSTPASTADAETAPAAPPEPLDNTPWSMPGYGMTLETHARRRAFLASHKDAAAAAEREALVTGRLGAMPEGLQLHEVDCRQSGCRVILVFDDDEARTRNIHFMRHLRRALGLQLGVERHDLPDGGRSFSFYLD